MKNAFVTEVGYRLRNRLGYFLKSGLRDIRSAATDEIEKCDERTSHHAEGGPPSRQHSQILSDCTTPDPKYRFEETLRK